VEIDSSDGSDKKCSKFITKQAMSDEDRELVVEMPWF
jgi:hypothetical protein